MAMMGHQEHGDRFRLPLANPHRVAAQTHRGLRRRSVLHCGGGGLATGDSLRECGAQGGGLLMCAAPHLTNSGPTTWPTVGFCSPTVHCHDGRSSC